MKEIVCNIYQKMPESLVSFKMQAFNENMLKMLQL